MPSVIRVLAGAMLLAVPATAAFDNMGPAAFMWPPDRPWSADADNTAPCGSDAGPVNRTSFPMRNGKVAFVAQDESYDVELSISYKSDPESNDDFVEVVSASTFREMDLGHTCINVPNAPSSVGAGSNATWQIKYIADFDKPENQTFYACADITYVSAISDFGAGSAMCFNATEPSTNKGGSGKATATPSPSSSSAAGSSGKSSSGLSGGAIAGIVIGCLAGVGLVGAGAFIMYRRRQRRQSAARQEQTARGVKWEERSATSQGSIRMDSLSR